MKKQIKYTEDVLFNNYMVSSLGEEYVHSQIPFYFDKITYEKMVFYSEEINRISLKILDEIAGTHKEALNYFDDFTLKDKIFNLKSSISPMFWTRYDTFMDTDDNIYFAEFNYDKPCGQKEIHLAGKSNFEGNLNGRFIDALIKELKEICYDYSNDEEKINVGFLMDPCHYEEFHHSYYFKDILKNTNINIVQVGPNNLSVKDGYVYGYSQIKLPIILRLFPTEFFYEIANINEILESINIGKLLLINDPRIIAIQAKGFFAYLWNLIKKDSKLLSLMDKKIISKCIPYTELLKQNDMKDVIKNKDKYVIKSSLGRYSEEVYIGKLYTQEAWNKKMKIIFESNKIHVKQNLINIKQEYTYAPGDYNMNIPNLAFGNFGVYLIQDKVQGFLVRWSKSFLTNDNYTWMCPLGVKEPPIYIKKFKSEDRRKVWEDLIEEVTFKYDFTGAYTNVNEYISLDSLIINENIYKEMIYVSHKFCEILKRIYPYIQENIELFGPILGIPQELYKLVSTSLTSSLCALGRIDFVIDNNGDLKLLEFNSETPAGLVEAIGVNSIFSRKFNIEYENTNKSFKSEYENIDKNFRLEYENLNKKFRSEYRNPNKNLKNDIKKSLSNILQELKKSKKIKNIGVVTSWYYEDIYTSELIAEILKELQQYNVIVGNVYDLKVKNNKIYLYGKEIDAIYRHYPLDWFYYNEEMRGLIEILNSGDYLINPGHTLITQSKAFLAVIHELIGKGFFSENDEKFILKYIPYTCLERDKKLSSDYVIKPYLSREGTGITLSYTEKDKISDHTHNTLDDAYKPVDDTYNASDDVVFQNRVNIKPLNIDVYSTIKRYSKYQFPVIGVYITNDKPCGIYTRMGDFITNKNAIYMPAYVK